MGAVMGAIMGTVMEIIMGPVMETIMGTTATGLSSRSAAFGAYRISLFLLRTRFSAKGANQALYLPLGNSGDIFTHPEGLLYIDGVSLASADRHHHLIDIPERYCDGQLHELALHGWTGWAG